MLKLNKKMMESAVSALKEHKASALLLFVDAIEEKTFWKGSKEKKKFILITQSEEVAAALEPMKREVKALLRLPMVKLTRIGQVKLSLIMAVTEGMIKSSDKVVCLSGLQAHGLLDTLMIIDLKKEAEVFTAMGISMDLLKKVKPEVLETVLNIALELSGEGREGKAIGATFVIGDNEKVMKLSRPLIMNPFKGYPEEARNILDEDVHETIKEFALLDGAFVIREDGVVMSAGVHLDAALEEEGHMPGLGCRHMAAAGITDVTEAAAITISGSTGIVRIFRKGKVLLELERPKARAGGPPLKP
ncbi:MAG TPA: hypothetical protein DDW94_09260 [Deltaproteobacteria bacterium]|nr:MAG: hypothetical protein A2Z79_03760 [Deltaproteobacteria bacterium GWA2_55_82]OGQ63660.1 MAG: hypothetical protein A3I81_02865 [Deltaproteobacteria bacterium RIFCSPLOWO2_02_FULL_55_12]OIJ74498.1 MAG: hypothetical protein A2V21_309660 [Deltaproteobacteria bacterium GWC2_55_46]HBG47159.1 hypothetical protein [Deltaproteobacteria bacterium]HCY10780.1 hypothetical protein [Deltaproteobacteria bacterium]